MRRELDHRTIFTQTSPDAPIQIVAAINHTDEGAVFDWAVYIGCGLPFGVARDGEKLPASWAFAIFPHLPIELYRA